jgi:hypothetical protein
MLTKLTAAASHTREAEASRQIPTQKIFDMTQSEQFDTELFILEIEERPALWNSVLKEYSDKL